eukprot:GHVQ01009123.1.p2 GENE.GHVQ01009123.1~~GHVQ01009123.1.p2  ORF type:complete len:881 (-),score=100.04 GHVQ01009123.1:3508-6150(-)
MIVSCRAHIAALKESFLRSHATIIGTAKPHREHRKFFYCPIQSPVEDESLGLPRKTVTAYNPLEGAMQSTRIDPLPDREKQCSALPVEDVLQHALRQLSTASLQPSGRMKHEKAVGCSGRVYVHVDMDMFYCAVEMRDSPYLRRLPVAVGGTGMLCTANYIARKYGVRAAMPGFIAKKLCPDLVIISPNMSKYTADSQIIRRVFKQYDPHYEAVSLDEAYLDFTDYCRVRGLDTSQQLCSAVTRLRQQVFEHTRGLTCSAGIAPTKVASKICSETNKPNGQTFVAAPGLFAFMENLNVRKLPGVGKCREQQLTGAGVNTCKDILDKAYILKHLFTETTFNFLMRSALGLDNSPLSCGPSSSLQRSLVGQTCSDSIPDRDYSTDAVGVAADAGVVTVSDRDDENCEDTRDDVGKSVSCERSFSPTSEIRRLQKVLLDCARSLGETLSNSNKQCRCISVKVKFFNFICRTSSVSVSIPTDSPLDILCRSKHLMHKLLHSSATANSSASQFPAVRLIGIRCANLCSRLIRKLSNASHSHSTIHGYEAASSAQPSWILQARTVCTFDSSCSSTARVRDSPVHAPTAVAHELRQAVSSCAHRSELCPATTGELLSLSKTSFPVSADCMSTGGLQHGYPSVSEQMSETTGYFSSDFQICVSSTFVTLPRIHLASSDTNSSGLQVPFSRWHSLSSDDSVALARTCGLDTSASRVIADCATSEIPVVASELASSRTTRHPVNNEDTAARLQDGMASGITTAEPLGTCSTTSSTQHSLFQPNAVGCSSRGLLSAGCSSHSQIPTNGSRRPANDAATNWLQLVKLSSASRQPPPTSTYGKAKKKKSSNPTAGRVNGAQLRCDDKTRRSLSLLATQQTAPRSPIVFEILDD